MTRQDANIPSISLEDARKKCLDDNFSSVEEKNNCVEIFMNHGNLEDKIAFIIGIKSNEGTIPFLEDLSNKNKILIFKQIQVELGDLSNQNIHLCRNEESQSKAKIQLVSQLEQQDEVILKLRQELKGRDEKIFSQKLELRDLEERKVSCLVDQLEQQDEEISILKQELKGRDEKILSQKQELDAIRSLFLAAPNRIEPPSVRADIVQDGFEGGEVRPSSAPLFSNTKESRRIEPNARKTSCFSAVLGQCVTM
jgi:hypothetical protein